jgi:hypothetical protein
VSLATAGSARYAGNTMEGTVTARVPGSNGQPVDTPGDIAGRPLSRSLRRQIAVSAATQSPVSDDRAQTLNRSRGPAPTTRDSVDAKTLWTPRDRFVDDSALEQTGFEPLVPPHPQQSFHS